MVNVTSHTFPADTWLLTTPIQGPMPVADHLKPERIQAAQVHRNPIVMAMSVNYRLEPLSYFWHRIVHAFSQLKFNLFELRPHFLLLGLALNREHSITPLLHTDVGKAEKIKCRWFALALVLGVVNGIGTKLNDLGLFWMQLQGELGKTLLKFLSEDICLALALKANDDVVSPANHNHVPLGLGPSPCMRPQIKSVVQIHVGQKRRCTSSLWRTLLCVPKTSILKHTSIQPLLDQTDDALVRDSVLEESDQPKVGNCVEKPTNVAIKHVVDLFAQLTDVKGIKAVMLAFARPVAVGEPEKVDFVDGIEYFDNSALDDFVFQRCDAQWALLAVVFGDKHPTYRLRSVPSPCQPSGEIQKILFQILFVVPPCLPVHTRCSLFLQTPEAASQRVQVVDMVKQGWYKFPCLDRDVASS